MNRLRDRIELILYAVIILMIGVLFYISLHPLPKEFFIKMSNEEIASYENKIYRDKGCNYINIAEKILINYKLRKESKNSNIKIKKLKEYITKCK